VYEERLLSGIFFSSSYKNRYGETIRRKIQGSEGVYRKVKNMIIERRRRSKINTADRAYSSNSLIHPAQ